MLGIARRASQHLRRPAVERDMRQRRLDDLLARRLVIEPRGRGLAVHGSLLLRVGGPGECLPHLVDEPEQPQVLDPLRIKDPLPMAAFMLTHTAMETRNRPLPRLT